LAHAEIDYVPAEADTGGAAPEDSESVPWPAASPETDADAKSATDESAKKNEESARSDDWSLGEATLETEANFEELQAMAPTELERFHREFEGEHAIPVVSGCVGLARAVLASDPLPDERLELARFIPRVLRQAVVNGMWRDSTACIELLSRCRSPEWSVE